LGQRRREQPVELVAEPAASPGNDLVFDRRQIETDLAVERTDVEILEGHVEQVTPMEVGEHRRGRFDRIGIGIPDAVQIGEEVDRHGALLARGRSISAEIYGSAVTTNSAPASAKSAVTPQGKIRPMVSKPVNSAGPIVCAIPQESEIIER